MRMSLNYLQRELVRRLKMALAYWGGTRLTFFSLIVIAMIILIGMIGMNIMILIMMAIMTILGLLGSIRLTNFWASHIRNGWIMICLAVMIIMLIIWMTWMMIMMMIRLTE